MTLRRNIAANVLSQTYVTFIGILLVPVYVKYMGAEAYGLVGFFAMLQAFFGMLDLGLTPTISRETARYRGRGLSAADYLRLFRCLSIIFSAVAIVGGGAVFALSKFLATTWLNVENIPPEDVVISLKIVAIIVALRWKCGLYRGVVTGFEKLAWLGGFNVAVATLRSVGVLLVMWIFGFTTVVFFVYQLIVASVEIIWLFLLCRQLLPSEEKLDEIVGWSFAPVKSVLRFSLTIAFTSVAWILVTQIDKLILSGILPLSEYGYFTLAVLVANGVMIVSSPVSGAIMPRMARLHAEGNTSEMMNVYRSTTKLVSAIAATAAITIVIGGKQFLFAWTGDSALAESASPILKLYAAGNGLLAVSAFPYYLQYAKGNLKYHLAGNVILVSLLIPSIIYAAGKFGGQGAGWAWLIMNSIYLFLWVGYVHGRLVPGLHLKWLMSDILSIWIPIFFAMFLVGYLPINIESRLESLGYVFMLGMSGALMSALLNRSVREKIIASISK